MRQFWEKEIQAEASARKLSLYEIIMEDLLEQIRQNQFSYEEPFCTEKQVMETYGVSRITAKRAVNELEQRGILYRKRGVGSFVAAFGQLDFTAARAARDGDSEDSGDSDASGASVPWPQNTLSSGSLPLAFANRSSGQNPAAGENRNYALLLPFDVTRGGIIDTVETISSYLNAHGASLGLYITGQNAGREKNTLRRLASQPVSGILYYPVSGQLHLEQLHAFLLRGLPVIVLDKSTDCPYLPTITSDNVEGGRLLARHLISLGHKRIAFLTHTPVGEASTVRDRFAGYLAEMQAHRLPLFPDSLLSFKELLPSYTPESGTAELSQLLLEKVRSGVTALITENDILAYAVLQACRSCGIRVPEDLSICGFDNTVWSQTSSPGITTVSQHFTEIGSAVCTLLEQLPDLPLIPAVKQVIPVHLEIRGSTGAPPSGDREKEHSQKDAL